MLFNDIARGQSGHTGYGGEVEGNVAVEQIHILAQERVPIPVVFHLLFQDSGGDFSLIIEWASGRRFYHHKRDGVDSQQDWYRLKQANEEKADQWLGRYWLKAVAFANLRSKRPALSIFEINVLEWMVVQEFRIPASHSRIQSVIASIEVNRSDGHFF